ncbi:MAG: glycosyltransferase [Candidatus Omnitrophica bacterium]|jgi:GT2 family glycosyltransferase|nr:glycosyltransferase [Candidatus Omnitrophota bacterium]
MLNFEIFVLNYNGKDLLAECLPTIIEACKKSRYNGRVTVIDNQSKDASVEFLRESFPQVIIHIARENKVLCSFNEAVEQSEAEFAIFLNNDIKVEVDFVDPLLEHFHDNNVFFIAPCVLNFDGTFNGGKSYIKMKYGFIKVEVDREIPDLEGITQSIACGAFRKSIFLQLGGYDSLYLPGYWEDTDLCYRGLKMGYKGIYEPKSRIYHKESTTFAKSFSQYKRKVLVDRNMFLFTWKNISSFSILAQHLLFLLPRLLHALVSAQFHTIAGFIQAFAKLPIVFKKRKCISVKYGVPDTEIVKI